MASLLRELKNDRAILIMYLADELPADDRSQIEARLAGSAPLRNELEALRQLQQSVFGQFDDASEELTAADEAAIRRVLREMRRHQVEQAARPAPPRAARFRRPPKWSYPLLTAAAAVLIVLGLWDTGALDGFLPPPGAALPGVSPAEPSPMVAADFERSFHIGRGMEALDEANAHAHALADEDESDALLLMM